jgi:UV DNA damage repair endonuclease
VEGAEAGTSSRLHRRGRSPGVLAAEKITVEIKAKAKEVAVLKLKKELEQQGKRRTVKITQKQS